MERMKAVVLHGPCAPEALATSTVPIPAVRPGWVLVRIRAFGLNHSEVIFRRVEAAAPYIELPRIPGIECAGEVADPSDSGLRRGQRVVALMGGMGRSFDGSYAEYALLPTQIVFPVESSLDWAELAAIPETYFTVHSALFDCLQLAPHDSLLVRGATSAAGRAALQLAQTVGCRVFASTRRRERLGLLAESGAVPVLDDGSLPEQLRAACPGGVTRILELVGAATLLESMSLLAHHGIACDVGVLGGRYALDGFDPIKDLPSGVYLTSFFSNHPTQGAMDQVFSLLERRGLRPVVDRVFPLEGIGGAHALMEAGQAVGKVVVLVS